MQFDTVTSPDPFPRASRSMRKRVWLARLSQLCFNYYMHARKQDRKVQRNLESKLKSKLERKVGKHIIKL